MLSSLRLPDTVDSILALPHNFEIAYEEPFVAARTKVFAENLQPSNFLNGADTNSCPPHPYRKVLTTLSDCAALDRTKTCRCVRSDSFWRWYPLALIGEDAVLLLMVLCRYLKGDTKRKESSAGSFDEAERCALRALDASVADVRDKNLWKNDGTSFKDFLSTGIPISKILYWTLETVVIDTMKILHNDRCGRDQKQKGRNLKRQKSNTGRQNFFLKKA